MSRKETYVTIRAEGRDKNKVFKITEMSADHAERWALRVLSALARSGFQMGEDLQTAGMAGIAVVGAKLFGNIPFEELEVLLDEMFRCVTYVPSPERPDVVRQLMSGDIEEVVTRIRLRTEVLSLHTGFSFADVLLILRNLKTSASTSTTQTSQEQSA